MSTRNATADTATVATEVAPVQPPAPAWNPWVIPPPPKSATLAQIESEPDRLYSVSETAKILGKSEYTIRFWLREGKLRGCKVRVRHGGSWVVTRDWRITGFEIIDALGETICSEPLRQQRASRESEASKRRRAMACLG